ncbi:MAG: hypothetical protein AB3N20_03415 [Rhizobiaceae bacterium]
MKSMNWDLALKLVATGIALFGVWKYFDDREHARISEARKASLAVIDEYSSAEMIAIRRSLVGFWQDNQKFIAFIRKADKIGKREYNNFILRALPRYKDFETVRENLYLLSNYYDRLYYCRDSEVCDRQLLDRFNCPILANFAIVYGPFFDVINRTIHSSHYGKSMRDYANACSGA